MKQNASGQELESKLDSLYEQNEETVSSSNLYAKVTIDIDSEKAALMGNRESIMFVYMLNCVICILFLIQGILMWRAAKPTLEMIDFLKVGGVENVPADLK